MKHLDLYLEEYRQVHEEVRLYMKKAYWIVFYYPALIAGIAGVLHYINPNILQALSEATVKPDWLQKEGLALVVALLLLPILSGAVQFFGLYWLFRELRATAYLGWLGQRIRAMASGAGELPPLWHELSFTSKLSSTVHLIDGYDSAYVKIAELTEQTRAVLVFFTTIIPTAVSLVIIWYYCSDPELHTPFRWGIVSAGLLSLLVSSIYALQYIILNVWLSKQAYRQESVVGGSSEEVSNE